MGAGGGMEIKKWSWLVFPALVGIMIIFSFGKLVAGPNQIWRKLWLNEGKVKAAEVEVAKLKNKLDRLKQVDVAGQQKLLADLGKAVPSQMQPMLLVGEMNQAASESGMVIEKYRIDDSGKQQLLKVSLMTGDMGKLIAWVDSMERWLPLVKIVGINYKDGRADIEVEQWWKESAASGAKPDDELPETAKKIKIVMEQMAGYRELMAGVSLPADDGSVNSNPF